MVSLKHGAKKRLNRSTTRSKTIQTGISTEYTNYRRKLDVIVSAIKNLTRQIKNTRSVWTSVAKHQKDFAEALVSALPNDGPVREHAKEVESLVRTIHPQFLEADSPDSAHQKLIAVLDAYLSAVNSVQRDYPAVEMAYTEVLRYQRKVDKLEKKAQKNQTPLQRNMQKLSAAHVDYDAKLTALLGRMNAEYDKHHAVFQCAHHAFWLANNRYVSTMDSIIRPIRVESMAVHAPLLRLDVAGVSTLTPLPRLYPSPNIIGTAPAIEFPVPSAPPPQVLAIEPEPQHIQPAAPPPPAAVKVAGPASNIPQLPSELPAPPPPPPPVTQEKDSEVTPVPARSAGVAT